MHFFQGLLQVCLVPGHSPLSENDGVDDGEAVRKAGLYRLCVLCWVCSQPVSSYYLSPSLNE